MDQDRSCQACGKPLAHDALTLWDGRDYCHACVQAFSPGLCDLASSGGPLQETVTLEQLSVLHYFLWQAVPCWLLSLLFFGIPLAFSPEFDALMLVVLVVFLTAFNVVFFSIHGVVELAQLRARLPRTISFQDGDVCIVTSQGASRVKLSECAWYFGKTSPDHVCRFTGLRRGVVLQTPGAKFALGHSPAMLAQLPIFLTLAGVPQNPPLGCLRIVVIGILSFVAGLLGGAGIGMLVAAATGDEAWIAHMAFLGALDFPIAALYLATCTRQGARAARAATNPLGLVVVLILLGMASDPAAQQGITWVTAALGIFNALFGLLIVWRCRVKIRRAEQQLIAARAGPAAL